MSSWALRALFNFPFAFFRIKLIRARGGALTVMRLAGVMARSAEAHAGFGGKLSAAPGRSLEMKVGALPQSLDVSCASGRVCGADIA